MPSSPIARVLIKIHSRSSELQPQPSLRLPVSIPPRQLKSKYQNMGAKTPEAGEATVWLRHSASQVVRDNFRVDEIWRTRTGGPTNQSQTVVRPVSAFDDRRGAFDDRRGPTVIHQYRSVDTPNNRHVAAASAPVNVPEWSKMVRVDSLDSMNGSVEFDRDESEWVPPHEYLAREHGRRYDLGVRRRRPDFKGSRHESGSGCGLE
ncbi:uncharacterized protein A4U43_C03F12460 [Asparagus officinalis]|uniref:Uncharacterized protein n=1 Tax=Asparagus officinalis TaxID=4686 RepID=A0A5P1FC96_ASPOF|nr:uncharacterized protein A4U43_C03F12460 [Asparagus officinalis]